MMRENLRLHRQARQQRPPLHPITHAPKHHIRRPRHIPDPQLVQQAPRPLLRHPVPQRTRAHARPMHDARVRGVFGQQVPPPVLDVQVLLLGHAGIVGDDGAAERRVGVARFGEARPAVAQPEHVPAVHVAVGGGGWWRYGARRGEVGDVEVGGLVVGGARGRVGRVEESGGGAGERLEEEVGAEGEGAQLLLEADVPVDVVFEDEGGGEVLLDNSKRR